MDFWHQANGVISAAGVVALSWVVLHPRIHEGVVIKAGLIAMIFSLGATALLTLSGTEDWQAFWRAGFVLRAGLCCVGIGVLLRAAKLHRKARHG